MNKNSNSKPDSGLKTASGMSLVFIAIAENIPYSTEYEWIRSIAVTMAPVLSGFAAYFISECLKKNAHLSDEQKSMLITLKCQQKHITKTLKNKKLNDAIKAEWQQKLSDNLESIHEVYQLSITDLLVKRSVSELALLPK